MSKQVDERVVSMQFDNKHFERNVSTTMSTLDKLKQKLHLDGASKGLENVSSAAKRVDMTTLGNGVEAVRSRFSALEVMGVTALANLTNSAVNAGKRIVSALTIDPVKTGFNEYELKMDSVKTIMASTGEDLKIVNRYLEELNEYSDQTIYSFADMTQNIGKFTNAGVKLEDAVLAIKGISNEAALSGANANEASRAMYNFAQALSVGYIQRIDWKSIELANMATVEFKKQLLDSAVALGTVKKNADDTYATLAHPKKAYNAAAMFTETLDDQWLTTEVLINTLKDYSDATTDIGKRAFAAAQDVTKLSQMFDILKETAQSGWAKTWEILFGDLEKAKAFFTPLTEFFQKIIDTMSDARNVLLGGALNMGDMWDSISKKFENSGIGKGLKKIKEVANAVDGAADKVKYFQDVVTKVWRGDYNNWGDNPDRFDLLEKAGYDHRVVQDLVNKGYQYKITMEDIEASHKKFGLTMEKTTDATKNAAKSNGKLEETYASLTDEQLEKAGLTAAEIRLYRDLEEESKRLGISMETLIDTMSKTDGRTLLIESLKNAGSGLVKVLTAIKDAWLEIFPPMSAVRLYSAIVSLNKFSESLKVSDETADKIRRTLKGLFAIVDILTTIFGGAFKMVFKVVTQLLSYFNLDILDVTAAIGDVIVKVRDWFDSILDFTGIFEFFVPLIKRAAEAIKGWFNAIGESEAFQAFKKYIKGALNSIKEWMKSLKESDNIARDILAGLWNGLTSGVSKVWDIMVMVGTKILEAIKSVLGIHSPSTEFFEIGINIFEGLLNGLKEGAIMVWNFLKGVATKCIEIFKSIDWGMVLNAGLGVGALMIGNKIAAAFTNFTQMFEGIGEFFESLGEGVEKYFKARALNLKAKALRNMAVALGIIAGAVALLAFTIGSQGVGTVWIAVGVIGAIAVLMGALMAVINKWGPENTIELASFSLALLGMTGSILQLAVAIEKLAKLETGQLIQGTIAVGLLGAMLVGLIAATKLAGKDINLVSAMLFKLSISFMLMTFVMKMLAGMSLGDFIKGVSATALLGAMVVGLMAATRLAGGEKGMEHLGRTIRKMSTAILMLALTAMVISWIDTASLVKGGIAIVAFGGIITGLVAITRLAQGTEKKIGSTIMAMAGAMLIMSIAAMIMSGISIGGLTKGLIAVGVLAMIIKGLVMSTQLASDKDIWRVRSVLIAMSVCIGIMGAVAALFSLMDTQGLIKGIAAVSVLGLLIAYMTKSARLVRKDTYKTVIGMTVAIGILVAGVAALSFIDPKKLAGATGAIVAILGTLALVIGSLSLLKGGDSVNKTVFMLMGMMAMLAAVVWIIADCNPDNALPNAIAMGVLLAAISGSLLMLSNLKVGSTAQLSKVLGMLAGLALVVIALGYALGHMSMMNTEGAVEKATAISILLGAMVGVYAALGILGKFASTSFIAIGGLAVLGLVVAEIGLVFAMMSALDVNPSIETATALSIVLMSMTASLAVLSVIGLIAPAAFLGIAALVTLVTALAAMLLGLGALFKEFPMLEEFLDYGIPILNKLGNALGSFFGNIVDGFITSATAGLPELGLRLGEFMTNAQPFIDGAKTIDEGVLKGIGALAGAVIALTAADFVSGIASFISGGSSFAQLGTDLSNFMTNAKPFFENSKLIDASLMDGVKSLAEAVLILTGANLLEGLTSWFAGDASLADFGKELAEFGPYIKQYAAGVDGIDAEVVQASANAAKALSEVAANLPNSGGVVGFFTGENDMDTFGTQLVSFGKSLKAYSLAVTGLQVEPVTTSVEAAKALIEVASTIPDAGGVISWFAGDNTLDVFGEQLVSFGTSLKLYCIAVNGLLLEPILTSVDAAKAIVEVAKVIPDTGGLVSFFAGDNTLDVFGNQLVEFGSGLKKYSIAVNGINDEAIHKSVSAAMALSRLEGTLNDSGGVVSFFAGDNNLASFGGNLVTFGGQIKEYSEVISDVNVEAITNATSAFEKVVSLASDAEGIDFGGLSSFGTSLSNMGQNGIDNFVKTFENAGPRITEAGGSIIDNLVKGITKQATAMSTAFSEMVRVATTAIKEKYQAFYDAGAYLVTGFANGISANTYKAIAKSKAMASAAEEAAKEELDVNSPSRVGYEIGDYFGMGFTNAISDYASKSYDVSATMANAAKSGLNNAISKINDFITADIDTQPTIRPVLDLSDVESGVGTMAGLLSMNSSVGVLSNVNSISSSMNNRSQNGAGDILSALNKLRKDISNLSTNSYNINGISYNDGTDVSDAIKTIVRAARIGGRT